MKLTNTERQHLKNPLKINLSQNQRTQNRNATTIIKMRSHWHAYRSSSSIFESSSNLYWNPEQPPPSTCTRKYVLSSDPISFSLFGNTSYALYTEWNLRKPSQSLSNIIWSLRYKPDDATKHSWVYYWNLIIIQGLYMNVLHFFQNVQVTFI